MRQKNNEHLKNRWNISLSSLNCSCFCALQVACDRDGQNCIPLSQHFLLEKKVATGKKKKKKKVHWWFWSFHMGKKLRSFGKIARWRQKLGHWLELHSLLWNRIFLEALLTKKKKEKEGKKKQERRCGSVPVVSGLLRPAAAAARPWVAGWRLVAGGAAVVLVPLIARGDLGVLQILHHPVERPGTGERLV